MFDAKGFVKNVLILTFYISTWSFRNVYTMVAADKSPKYSTFGNVLVQELIKLTAALVMCKYSSKMNLSRELFDITPKQVAPYVVPAVLYTINNQLVFYAIGLVRSHRNSNTMRSNLTTEHQWVALSKTLFVTS